MPSLINRADVLDLEMDHSLLRFLAASGVRPLLLDWGWPGLEERALDLGGYIAGPLAGALEAARALNGEAGPVGLIGYCMGGTLAVAAALRRPDLVRALALLAAPWDFWADTPDAAATAARLLAAVEPAMALTNAAPVDALQAMFATIDPGGVPRKYRAFAALDPDSERARRFVLLEDWLNDGVPLAAPVMRNVLGGWYGRNEPARGLWRVEGTPVRPDELRLPAFVAIPARDRIVPPGSARALADAIPGAVQHAPDAGHIGMVVGSTAEAALWRPLAEWLRARLVSQSAPPATRSRRPKRHQK